VRGRASCAKSRRALFAKNSNGPKKSKNFIYVSECADRREQGIRIGEALVEGVRSSVLKLGLRW